MLSHKCKDMTNVCSMNFYILLSAQSPTMDEFIVKATRCEISHQSQQICDASVECGWGITNPLWHNPPFPEHIAGGSHCCEWGISFKHKDLIVPSIRSMDERWYFLPYHL